MSAEACPASSGLSRAERVNHVSTADTWTPEARGTYDPSKTPGDNGKSPKVPRLQSRVFPGAPLAVVPVSDHDPLYASLLVVASSGGNGIVSAGYLVLHFVGLSVRSVDGANKHVVGDIVKMTAVLEPGTSHCDPVSVTMQNSAVLTGRLTRDMIRGCFALGLDQDGNVDGIFPVPRLERLEDLQAVT